MGYRNAILSIVSETTFNMPHSSVLYHRFKPGLNRVKWNRIEQYRIVFDRGMSALRRDFPSRSIRLCVVIVSLFYNREWGGGEREEVGRLRAANADQAFDHVQEISGPRIPRKISASSKLPCRPPTVDIESFWNRLLFISCDNSQDIYKLDQE